MSNSAVSRSELQGGQFGDTVLSGFEPMQMVVFPLSSKHHDVDLKIRHSHTRRLTMKKAFCHISLIL